ncbi:glycosyltransferase family 2 protein [Holophaga foetida]|uniref:glycosyltransferase family 2 protein n=1 Tax=Holophaga foetida TaxID=35839 RepID=UPI00024717AC|nr:glycosyltransferase [Holophaga foetida]
MSPTTETLLIAIQWGILLYFLLLHGIQFLLILKAFFAIRNYQGRTDADPLDNLFETTHALPITLVCPAYNESAGVVASVSSLISLRYPEFQVVVVNDGSTDDTVAQLVAAFRMKPTKRVIRQLIPTQEVRTVYESPYVRNLVVVDKENGGKADALNCGINMARYHLVCCMDADSLLEPDALLRVVRPFLDEPNTAACGGVIRPLNGCRVTSMGIRGIFMPDSWLARFQVVEYLRAFLFGRMGLSSLGALFIVSGAFGLFRKDILVRSGGFCTDIVGEDFEMVVRLHHLMLDEKKPYHISLVPDPICWTEAPEDFKPLRRQRSRWQRGLMETLWMHRRMWFSPRYGRIGLFSMPYFLLFEALAPWVEVLGYGIALWAVWSHTISTPFALLFLWMSLLLGIFNSVVAVVLQEITLHRYQGLGAWGRLLLTAILENFGYRQLTLFWRLQGSLDFVRGKRNWGRMDRYGLKGKDEAKTPSAL